MKFLIIVFFSLFALWVLRKLGRLPSPFRERDCQGKGWRRAFPGSPKQEIRKFLLLFVHAFAFSGKERLKLKPEDRPLAIYKAVYPSQWMADALELETWARDLQQEYGFKLRNHWNERITLGEIFRACLKARSK